MASTTTGEMFTQEQYEGLTPERRDELDIVKLTPSESARLAPMSKEQRKDYLKSRKAKSKQALNKRERQNKRKARNATR